MIKEIKLWYYRNFIIIDFNKTIELNLQFCFNIYGDLINRLNCRSIYKDNKNRYYTVKQINKQ